MSQSWSKLVDGEGISLNPVFGGTPKVRDARPYPRDAGATAKIRVNRTKSDQIQPAYVKTSARQAKYDRKTGGGGKLREGREWMQAGRLR